MIRAPFRTATWFCLAALIAALPGLIGMLSPHDLEMHSQARQALYVVDALDGHWWLPSDRGGLTTKPPLYTWLAALCAALLGLNEFTVRLPSLLATVGLGVVIFDLGRRLIGQEVGLLAVVLFATLEHVVKLSFFARTDMLLAFWIALAVWATLRPAPKLFWVSLALATLTKGPVGFAIPLLAVGLDALLHRDPQRFLRLQPRAGTTVALLIVAAWLLPALAIDAQGLWRVMIRREFIDRLTGEGMRAHAMHHPFWYLVPYLFLRLLPTSLLLPYAIARPDPMQARDARALLGSWLLAGWLVVSLSASKRVDYLLPIYPPALLLVATPLVSWRQGKLPRRATRALSIGASTWAVGVSLTLLGAAIALGLGLWQPASSPGPWVIVGAAAAVFPLGFVLRPGRSPTERLAAALVAQLLLLCVYANVLAAPAREPDAPMLRRFARAVQKRTAGEPVDFYQARCGSVQFLLRRNVAELELQELLERASGPEPSWVILSGNAYAELARNQATYRALGAPRVALRSGPRTQHQGDDLVLIRLGMGSPPAHSDGPET